MTAERWQRITELFKAALECEPQRRVALLEEACAGDLELRKQIGRTTSLRTTALVHPANAPS